MSAALAFLVESVTPFVTDECCCPWCSSVSVNIHKPPTQPGRCTPDGATFCRERAEGTRCPGCPENTQPTQPGGIYSSESGAKHRRRIIAFTGLAGSGKSTAALHLVSQGWTRVRFAGPLKNMMAALGCSQEQIEGSEKELPCDLLNGRTPRYAMQTIGTEWGRTLLGEDLWIRAWQAALAKAPGNVVVDDCRFPNEAEAVRRAGGHIVRVVRPGGSAVTAGHSSEGYEIAAMYELLNDVPMSVFLANVDEAVRDLSWVAASLEK